MGKLTDLKVKRAPAGIHGDGDGLYLRVKESGARSWVLRVQKNGKRQDVGLGGYPADLTLGEAREKAAQLRKLARAGHSAREERDREKVIIPTFAEAVGKAHSDLFQGDAAKTKSALAFKSSLDAMFGKTEDIKRIGRKRVDQIEALHVIACLSPFWTDKPALAAKLRVRIMKVLRHAKAHGWRGAVPDARDITHGLPKMPKGKNFASMPYRDAPDFVADQLGKEDTSGRLALLFTILTAARSGETRSARWEHIDVEAKEWCRPAELMKARVEHTVTLNDAAVAILNRVKALSGGKGLVFPGSKPGAPLSDMTLSKVLRSAERPETVHGFRATFRVWAAKEMRSVPAMVAEMALAHSVGNSTQQAYLQTDMPEARRELLDAWGRFIAPSLSISGDNIVTFSKAR